MCYVDGSSTKCFDEQCEDEYLLSKPAYDCTGKVSPSRTCTEFPKTFVQCNYWFTRSLCRVLFQRVRQGAQTVTTWASPKRAERGGCKAGYAQAANGDCHCGVSGYRDGCHCEYQGTGMGATVSGYGDGCHCEYQSTGMGVTVSGYKDGCHCDYQGTGMGVII